MAAVAPRRIGADVVERAYASGATRWERRLAREVGHARYVIRWYQNHWCIYRRTTNEDVDLRRAAWIGLVYRFAFVDEQNRPLPIDARIIDAVREDDLIFRDPRRFLRDVERDEVAAEASRERDQDNRVEAKTWENRLLFSRAMGLSSTMYPREFGDTRRTRAVSGIQGTTVNVIDRGGANGSA